MKTILLILLLAISNLSAAAVSMQLEASKVQEGESFKLILTLDGDQTDRVPDLTPLQKNFNIEGTQRSMSYTLINGQARSLSQWIILLTPKKTGLLSIPSIQVGQEKTNPSKIEVTQEAQVDYKTGLASDDKIHLLTELNEPHPYVNQQVILTVKLYNSRRLIDADYQPPKLEDGLLIPLGSGNHYQAVENGQLFTVEEQQYAFFPQKSGPVEMQPPVFRALIYDDVAPRRVTERGKPITINVKPIPSQYSGRNWLPAKQVSLSEKFDNNSSSLEQGSTLIRTIHLQAMSIPAQLLPTLNFATNQDEYNVYPEKPKQRTTLSQGNLVGHSTIKVSYLLNKAGKITIPALKLTWFNTDTGKEEIASLPAHTFQVRPTAAIQPTTKGNFSTQSNPSATPKEEASTKIKQVEELESSTRLPSSNLAWWLAAGFALAWLLTFGLWFWQRSKSHNFKQTSKEILKSLQRACEENNPYAVRDILIQWAQNRWPRENILNLTQITTRVNHEALKQEINYLAQALYHNNRQKIWQGTALWQAFLSFKAQKKARKENNNPLPAIHKL